MLSVAGALLGLGAVVFTASGNPLALESRTEATQQDFGANLDTSYPGTSGAPYNSSNFNAYGRAVYLEARYLFGQR